MNPCRTELPTLRDGSCVGQGRGQGIKNLIFSGGPRWYKPTDSLLNQANDKTTTTQTTQPNQHKNHTMFLGSARRLIRKRPVANFKKWKIVRGDEVVVVSGKDKGKRGVVRSILRNKNKVLVDGVNYSRKRVPASQVRGGHVSVEQPMAVSNVALVDPASGAPTKVAFRYVDGTKVRVAKKSGSVIAKPDSLKNRLLPLREGGPHDTSPSAVLEQTYVPLRM